MKEAAISPHFRKYDNKPGVIIDSKDGTEFPDGDVDGLILVYENRVTWWFLSYGKQLQREHNAAFVVLRIAIAPVEGLEQYRRGESSENRSSEFFRAALSRIFSLDSLDQFADHWLRSFYSFVRCGRFHDGMTRRKVLVNNRVSEALDYDGIHIRVNPRLFFDAAVNEIEGYICDLKEAGEYRASGVVQGKVGQHAMSAQTETEVGVQKGRIRRPTPRFHPKQLRHASTPPLFRKANVVRP